jgi:hypothetical protein
MTDKELNAIKKRCELATDGPWGAYPNSSIELHGTELKTCGVVQYGGKKDYGGIHFIDFRGEKSRIADIEFIAHAREDIPKLIKEIDRLNTPWGEE